MAHDKDRVKALNTASLNSNVSHGAPMQMVDVKQREVKQHGDRQNVVLGAPCLNCKSKRHALIDCPSLCAICGESHQASTCIRSFRDFKCELCGFGHATKACATNWTGVPDWIKRKRAQGGGRLKQRVPKRPFQGPGNQNFDKKRGDQHEYGGRRDMSQIECYNCGKKGHYRYQCRSTARTGGQPPDNRILQKGPCFKCGKMGHLAFECRNVKGTGGQPPVHQDRTSAVNSAIWTSEVTQLLTNLVDNKSEHSSSKTTEEKSS
jgi:hypothetical protein